MEKLSRRRCWWVWQRRERSSARRTPRVRETRISALKKKGCETSSTTAGFFLEKNPITVRAQSGRRWWSAIKTAMIANSFTLPKFYSPN